ncbi:MAG TPA: DUF4199 domain-containing protein [Candidatus Acidoferrales bacterium]|nr:DUF4199 domain-containing protein [Candidatus Acidoferrales bacterium]
MTTKKVVLTFGLISGAIAAGMMLITLPFTDKFGFDKGEIFGYTTIVLSALLIFFGVRSYRQNVSGGRLSFGRGFVIGILITLISNFCYVATWEVIYYKFMPNFADKYAAYMIDRAKASGATPEKIAQQTQEMEQFKQTYNNPVVNVAMTFMEVFPIGLGVTLLSAAILRKKAAASPVPA